LNLPWRYAIEYNHRVNAYETSTTVQPQGDIRLVGVPFAPGTGVEVTVSLKRKSADEFAAVWQRVCNELRRLPRAGTFSDDEIRAEIKDYRGGDHCCSSAAAIP
jgi:hypothetical protein